MIRYTYLILMALCLLLTLPLEFVFRARVYRRPLALITSVAITTILFSLFDLSSIVWGWWRYSSKYTTGIDIFGRLPIEEVVFFVVIPICSLLTLEAVRSILNRRAEGGRP
ncbi:MAG: lycopene cyclase domain-containing protein [Actinomycetota bacterium]|nr:lycopene cyclase domain-containing protein [Actinomycetota bacterium]